MNITVYTKTNCVQCRQTKLALDRAGVAYVALDVTTDPDAFAAAEATGQRSMPIVVAGDLIWGGYRPDMLKKVGV